MTESVNWIDKLDKDELKNLLKDTLEENKEYEERLGVTLTRNNIFMFILCGYFVGAGIAVAITGTDLMFGAVMAVFGFTGLTLNRRLVEFSEKKVLAFKF